MSREPTGPASPRLEKMIVSFETHLRCENLVPGTIRKYGVSVRLLARYLDDHELATEWDQVRKRHV